MVITPFHFHLKKVNGRNQRLFEALFDFLPQTDIRDTFHHAVAGALEKHVGLQISYRLEAVEETVCDQFFLRLGRPSLVAVVGMTPLSSKMFLDVDLALARLIVDRMLGGRGEPPLEVNVLSEIEQGVLQYLLLQLLAHLHRLSGENPRLHFRFEQFLLDPDRAASLADAHATAVVLTFRVHLTDFDGFVRLCLPHPLIEGAFLGSESVEGSSERIGLSSRLHAFDYVRFPLWAEAGRSSLSVTELQQLEVGDVVMFDHADIILEKGIPSGQVIVRAGAGREGGYLADLSVTGRLASCRLISGHRGE